MTSLTGQLKLGDQVVLESVIVALDPTSRPSDLRGSFLAPRGEVDMGGEPYTLTLSNGVSWKVLVKKITDDSLLCRVFFEGAG